MKHPIQPLSEVDGVMRFKENKIVSYLLDWCAAKNDHPMTKMDTSGRAPDLNELAAMGFSREDWQQLAQLSGYSLGGYSELSYVDDDAYGAAAHMANGKGEDKARIAHLEKELSAIRKALRTPMARLFGVHPDDLKRNP